MFKFAKPYHILCFLLFYLSLAFSNHSLAQDNTLIHFNTAKKIISNSVTPPNFSQTETIALPDHWNHDPHEFYSSVWYEIALNTLEKKQQWAIYLPQISMNAEVWVNDIKLGSGGNMAAPLARYWHSPMMFTFSPADIKQEKNHLYIKVVAFANEYGLLGNIMVSDRNTIYSIHQNTLLKTVHIYLFSGVLAGVYALFMLLVWLKRRDKVFFWGGAICFVWAIASMNFYVVNAIFSDLVWEKLMLISMNSLPILFFLFIRRLNDQPFTSKYEGNVLIGAAAIILSMIVTPQSHLIAISQIMQVYAITWAFVGVFHLFRSWFKFKKSSQLLMISAFLTMGVCGIHDVLIQLHIIETGQAFWFGYSVPIVLLLIGYLLVRRFLQAVQQSEELNQDLESRVQKAHDKIESDYEKILILETEQASNHERERIYRNLHDDMGSKLLSLVYEAENEEVSQLARGAMNDLRAIVSKKPKKDYLLNDMLNQWRTDCERRCSYAHFKFNWLQNSMPKLHLLNTDEYQNCLSLQAEAISNIIKHSNGNTITIGINNRFNYLQVSIFDNGNYNNLTLWQEGRGISSMRFRVKQLHGKIRWLALNNKGGVVRWIFPLSISGINSK